MNLLDKLCDHIRSRRLLSPGERLLVAVSGGLDSMVLLHLLHTLQSRFAWHLSVAHFNHRLRGGDSDRDESFVREESARLGLEFFTAAGEVKALAQAEGLSVEMAARKLRHQFLAETAGRHGMRRVVLAHHADDQVEGFWLQLLRGSVGESLGGMRPVGRSPADPGVLLVRPLLEVSRDELAQYALAQGITWREDATNAEPTFLRNRVRLELLPLLARDYQPGINAATLRLMQVLRDEKEWLAMQAAEWLRNPTLPFEELHPALQRAILRSQLLHHAIRADFELIERLRQRANDVMTVGSGRQIYRDSDGKLHTQDPVREEFRRGVREVELTPSGRISWEGRSFWWEVRDERDSGSVPNREVFDAERLGRCLRLRHWGPGDRFQPIGMSHAVKLQDLFTNLKIPAAARRHLVLAENAGGEIVWVEGLRIGAAARVTPETTRFLEWHWEPS